MQKNMSPILKTVQPSGTLAGAKASDLRREISELVQSGADIILVDFKDVTFIDSSGLGALVAALKLVRGQGRKIFICSLSPQLKMLFELASMDKLFEIFSNPNEFDKTIIQCH